MPFKSKKQRAWMYKNKPEMAAQWEAETPKGEKLPEKVPAKPKNPVQRVKSKTIKKTK